MARGRRGRGAVASVVARIADIGRRPGTRAPTPAVDVQSVHPHAFLNALEESGASATRAPAGGRSTSRSTTAAADRRRARRSIVKLHSAGRIRLRPRLGRRLRAGRRALLSQAADRRAVHARARAPPAGAARTRSGGTAQALLAAGGAPRLCERIGVSSVHVHLPHRGRVDVRSAAQRLPAAHRPAVPLAQRGLRDLRRFPGALCLAQTQGHPPGARARRSATSVVIERLTGADITEAHWDAFFAFYMDTGSRKWGRPYLNRALLLAARRAMADRCLLVMAERGGRYDRRRAQPHRRRLPLRPLLGLRSRIMPFLHFEVCYYQAIDYAIAQGLARVEAGAQGEHKLARGYCRSRPTRRIGSPIPRSRARGRALSCARSARAVADDRSAARRVAALSQG